MQTPSTIFIKIADYDLSALPEACRDPKSPGFADTLIRHVSDDYAADGMFAKVGIEQDTLVIAEDLEAKARCDEGLDALQRGVYAAGKPIFEALQSEHPNNAIVLYNLGMVYSDEGNLDKAIALLSNLTRLKPDYAHGWVALSVAYMRNNQIIEADQAAQKAVQLAPNDQYALRTAGYIAAKLNEPEAAALLENAVRAGPNDPIALLALAENLQTRHQDEAIKKRVAALLTQVIDVAPGSKAAERAEEILRTLAYDKFRQTGSLNPQAIDYCLQALKAFQSMSPQEVAGVAMEAAALGQSGLDVNNPNKTYQLRAVPGNYTGLQVVCFMYVALEQVAPGQDIGFDLKAEYAEAMSLFKSDKR